MINKLENWLFYIFLFAVPISLRHIFHYDPFQFMEWTAMYVYATDLLFFSLILFWAKNIKFKAQILNFKASDWLLAVFVVLAAISIKNAQDVQAAWFQWVKLIEGVALYYYIKNYALKRFEIRHGFEALVLGGVFQAVVAITQFVRQGSLGLKYLGESVLASGMTGIAAFLVDGVKVIRAYGTTPHSNILALYLFIALGAFYSIAIYQKRAWWWHAVHAIILWAFLLTFSRVIIGLWLITFVIRSILVRLYPRFHTEFWESSEMRRRSLKIFVTTVVVCCSFLAAYWPYVMNRSSISVDDEAVQLRMLYNHEATTGGINWFGHGIGNFVPWLQQQDLHLSRTLYQPVHNIYLLIYSEVGLLGALAFGAFLVVLVASFYRRLGFKKLYHFSFGLIIIVVLIVGLFDHFMWTIQSGRLLFWLVLGLLAGA